MSEGHGFFWRPDQRPFPLDMVGITVYEASVFLAVATGALVWMLLARRRGIKWPVILAGVLGACAVCAVFTRAVHIVFWSWKIHMQAPWRIWTIFEGGYSVQGAMLGFIVFASVFSRAARAPLAQVADDLSWWTPIGTALVRVGNFWVGEIRGTPSIVPWAVRFYFSPDRGAISRHPVQLYESGACLLLIAAMIFASMRGARRAPWTLSAMVLIGYPSIRFAFDFVKETDRLVDGFWLTTGQALCIPFFILGCWLAVLSARRLR